jgi:hypothetical protein
MGYGWPAERTASPPRSLGGKGASWEKGLVIAVPVGAAVEEALPGWASGTDRRSSEEADEAIMTEGGWVCEGTSGGVAGGRSPCGASEGTGVEAFSNDVATGTWEVELSVTGKSSDSHPIACTGDSTGGTAVCVALTLESGAVTDSCSWTESTLSLSLCETTAFTVSEAALPIESEALAVWSGGAAGEGASVEEETPNSDVAERAAAERGDRDFTEVSSFLKSFCPPQLEEAETERLRTSEGRKEMADMPVS